MKKSLAIIITVLMLATMILPLTAFAASTVYVSVFVDGSLKIAAKPVSISDMTAQGAIKAAHKEHFSGGEGGYAAGVDPTWNMFLISKCWGVSSTPYIIVNGAPIGANTSDGTADQFPVKAGDNIVLSISSDAMKPPLVVSMTASASGDSATLTAKEWTLNFMTFTYESKNYSGAIVDSSGGSLGSFSSGKATVKIPADGIIIAKGAAAVYVEPPKTAAPEPKPEPKPEAPAGLKANPTASTVLVDGESIKFDAYNINDNNYFKLRDIAFVLNGTAKQFSVGFDASANAIDLKTGEAYEKVDGDMAAGDGKVKTPTASTAKVILNGKEVSLQAYNIDGFNYFKLRDLGAAVDFGVDWDGANNAIVIDTSKGYTA